ncbi:MAG: indolepyruvate ferredoxin oxidoreductase [Rhodospirillaceae bacterium]|nr:indolepyruvate ferredoxin oxidoreductase [Rhodospirillaceae bacterium]
MGSSPRRPSSTIRIFSSAEYCLRVARRMSLIALAAPVCRVCDFCLIFVPFGQYDGPEILSYAISLICSIGADVGQTAVWGSQQTDIFGSTGTDGVFGMWYGKNPGLDRSGDALKHGNYAGTSRHGGVLAVSGDDPGASSSTIANQCEQAFSSAMIPVIYPADTGDILELGLKGYGLSRYSGLWAGFKLVADVVETTRSVSLDANSGKIDLPAGDFDADQVIQRWPDDRWSQDQRLQETKLPAALEFARVNGFNRVVMDAPGRRFGIVAAGKAYLDTRQALDELGVTDAVAVQIGLSVIKLGFIWPIEPDGMRAFARGLKEIIVVEERRAFIETQIKELAYNWPASIRPRIIGKADENGAPLIPSTGQTSPSLLAIIIGRRLLQVADHPAIRENLARIEKMVKQSTPRDSIPLRIPHYCPGCPHNQGTKLPDGGVAMAGIGCHSLAAWMPGANTITMSHMGAEGANWIGAAAFVDRDHVFQNMGDGTYAHSGILAIRAAIAAGARMTFKILYNNAVAMTGGQPVEGGPSVSDVARQMSAEGVAKLAVVSGAPESYSRSDLPRGTGLYPREELEAVMQDFSAFPGVSVLIYDQMCATEKRRQRKRGKRPPIDARVVINERVCEACGDCSEKSRCIAVRAVATPLGIKREIDQSSCNSDLSCLEGFCPAMVTVTGAKLRTPAAIEDTGSNWAIDEPVAAELEAPYHILIAGVGGTGLITIGAILGMAAHLEGNECSILDNTGLARMGGSVTTHVRLAPSGGALHAPRIDAAGADLLLGCDPLVAAGAEVSVRVAEAKTRAAINSHMAPTLAQALDPESSGDRADVFSAIESHITSDEDDLVDASGLALALLGDKIYANMLLTGFAFQRGCIPLGLAAIRRAIELNGTEVENNLKAFTWGRRLAADRQKVLGLAGLAGEETETGLGSLLKTRMNHLADYRNKAYAVRYGELVDKFREREAALAGASGAPGAPGALTEAVAENYFKLLAVKDEFEVARLFADGVFDDQLSAMFEGGYRVDYHIGRVKSGGGQGKRCFGPWFGRAMRLLAKSRGLRGSILNPFHFTADRKRDWKLIAEYEATAGVLLENLNAENLELATEIAAIPDAIRGFGDVRDRSLITARQRHHQLMAEFRTD